ncbi:MAG: metallophosphoesterase [Alphaproteobacteria bacterium]|nr:metallophosphoesterase [Alphaproteobacteria bacterium]
MGFKLAHFSDVHLGPLPRGTAFQDFAPKRIIGVLSWVLSRRKRHLPHIASALMTDIEDAHVDHVAFTGDLVNVAAAAEFKQGAEWLKAWANPDQLSFVPGNHDAYVPIAYDKSLGLLEAFMSNDMRNTMVALVEPFPFVRLRRNIALIGLSTAQPQTFSRVGGTVGLTQREALREKLKVLRERGFYRAVLIHHPPAPGLAHPFRALSDAAEVAGILKDEGADLVLHGHNHTETLHWLESPHGPVPVVGVPSASMTTRSHHPAAAWNCYDIDRAKGKWQTRLSIRQWQGSHFITTKDFELIKP